MKKVVILIVIFAGYLYAGNMENYPDAMPSFLLGTSFTSVDSTEFGMLDLSVETKVHIKYGLYASFEVLYNHGYNKLKNYNALSFIPNLKFATKEFIGLNIIIGAGTGYTAVYFGGGEDIGIISQFIYEVKWSNISLVGGLRIINNDYYNLKTAYWGLRYTFDIYDK